MRYTNLLSATLVAGILLTIASCSKGSDALPPPAPAPPTFEVEYRIQNFDDKVTSVRYIDDTGSSINLNNPLVNFPGGTKTIRVTKPFKAELEFFVANGSFSTRHYTLFIYVDGTMETNKQVSVPGFTTKKSIITVDLD